MAVAGSEGTSALPASADAPHEPRSDAAWSESHYFAWFSPAASGIARIATRPNEGTQDMLVAVFGSDGGALQAQAVREQRENDGALDVGGARAECEEPLRRWRLRFDGEVSRGEISAPLALDLVFEAETPPAETSVRVAGTGIERTVPNHFEQAVRVSGTIDGEPFEGSGFRDKSWGVRDWSKPGMWRWFALPFGPDLALNALMIELRGAQVSGGWCARDGVVEPVTAVDLDTDYAPDGLTQREVRLSVEVAGAERMSFTGDVLAVAPLVPAADGSTVVNEGLARWRAEDGREALGIAEYLHQLPARAGEGEARPSQPAGGGDLTPEWMTGVLRAAGFDGAAVRDVALEPLGDGNVADSFRAVLAFDGDSGEAPASVVVKLPAADETSRAGARAGRAYEREVRFYGELAEGLEIRVPACHRAQFGDDGGFVLVLEDVGPARVVDQIAGCGPDDAAAAMEQAAGLHAPRWGDPGLEQLRWLDLAQATGKLFGSRLPALWEGFRERYAGRLTPEVEGLCERIVPRAGEIWSRRSGPRTIVHGDYRTDNMLFDAHGGREPLVVVDWQTPALRDGPADVAFFLGNSVTTADRRAHERDLVRQYHEALLAGGVEGYDFDSCWDAYRLGSFDGMVMAIFSSMVVRRSDYMDELALTTLERSAALALDLEAEALLG